MTTDPYDSFANAYSQDNESNLINNHYERPAMINLAGDVLGRRVLDAGCGSGPLSAALRAKGATVLHYLEDWTAPLAELRRVLKPGGRLILSVNHPYVYKLNYPDADYFAVTQYSEEFSFAGQNATLTYWHRPLPDITAAFTEAGFRISVLSEPPYDPDTPRELLPGRLAERTAFICFMFFELEAARARTGSMSVGEPGGTAAPQLGPGGGGSCCGGFGAGPRPFHPDVGRVVTLGGWRQ